MDTRRTNPWPAVAWAALGLAGLLAGCAATSEPAASREAIVYGDDDRQDVWEHADPAFAERARQSAVALVRTFRVDRTDPNDVQLLAEALGPRKNLCPEERFVDQNTAAFCSGTLIDHDLVLTAGHCFGSPGLDGATLRSNCRQTNFVFGYHERADGEPETIRAQDVYGCRRLYARAYDDATSFYSQDLDYAIVQLDRPAIDAPIDGRGRPRTFPEIPTVDRSVPIASRTVVIGNPAGLPAKIDDGGYVLYSRPPLLDYFGASADAFASSSGSGVYDSTGTLIGILSRALDDYRPRFDGACNTVVTTSESGSYGSRATEMTYVRRAIDGLCADGFPSPLCGRAAACGDGECSGLETHLSCADDCDPPECGDGLCHPSETDCLIDCGRPFFSASPPASWTCETDRFDAGDGCDCECGAYDRDCDRQPTPVNGCEAGERCGSTGRCQPDPATGELPSEWTCFGANYGIGDGCHCGCGAPDPDCDDPSAEVVGCEAGEICQAGACAAAPPPEPDAGPMAPPEVDASAPSEADAGAPGSDPPSEGGCSVSAGAGPRGGLALVGLAMLAWLARRWRNAPRAGAR